LQNQGFCSIPNTFVANDLKTAVPTSWDEDFEIMIMQRLDKSTVLQGSL